MCMILKKVHTMKLRTSLPARLHPVRLLLLAGLLLFSAGAHAEITLPSIIGNNMVLQRQSDVALWGKADANAQVNVLTSWNEKEYSTKADAAGNWRLTVPKLAAGGPYEIRFTENRGNKTPIHITNLMISARPDKPSVTT